MERIIKMEDDFWGEPISVYTRKQAIEDGTLIDISELAKEAGFVYPVAITSGTWAEWIVPPEGTTDQDEKGRLWDLLNILKWEIKKSKESDRIDFKVLFNQGNKRVWAEFNSIVGPGDEGEPVITVLLKGED
jgi:hypothetical protein